MIKHNAAQRLSDLIRRANGVASSTAAADVWAQVLNVTGEDPNAKDQEVARLLGLARDELNRVRTELVARRAEPSMYQANFSRIELALSLRSISAAWDQVVKSRITDGVLTALSFAAFILDDEEAPLGQAELDKINAHADELLKDIDKSTLSPAVKTFLRRQARVMERAVREYPIRGAAAFRDASDDSATDWIEYAEVLRPVAADATVRKTASLFTYLSTLEERATLLGRVFLLALGVSAATVTGVRMVEAEIDGTSVLAPLREAVQDVPVARLLLSDPNGADTRTTDQTSSAEAPAPPERPAIAPNSEL